MSFADLLHHDLVIEHVRFDDDNQDAYGQPARSVTSIPVKGMVQPRRASELPDTRSAGAEVADHVIFLADGSEPHGADFIVWGEQRFAITGVRRIGFGSVPHLEVDARTVRAAGAANDGLAS